jgi:hypothetical protein
MKAWKKCVSLWLPLIGLSFTDVVALTICASCDVFSPITATAHHRDRCFFEWTDVPELERAEAARSKDVVQSAMSLQI